MSPVLPTLRRLLAENPGGLCVALDNRTVRALGGHKPHELDRALETLKHEGQYRVRFQRSTYRQNCPQAHTWEPDVAAVLPTGHPQAARARPFPRDLPWVEDLCAPSRGHRATTLGDAPSCQDVAQAGKQARFVARMLGG